MCQVFGYSKQAYYKQLQLNANTAVKEEVIVGLIKKKREIWKRGSGRNLHHCLQKEFKTHDIKIGRDKFFDVLRNNHLLIKSKRCRTKTTCSYHHFNRYKNLIENTAPVRANEIWVADITYLWLKPQDKFCYLSVITDLYSRKIVGHCVHQSLSVKGCVDALKQALKSRKDKGQSLVHHSDRGVQYCCHAYVKLLQKQQIQISMTQTGDPLENAVAERIHKTIKEEFTDDKQINFCNIEQAKTEIKKFIEFYNQKRPHRSVQWLTPNAAHYLRWKPEYRPFLFQYISLNKIDNDKLLFQYSIPKLKSVSENKILGKIISQKKILLNYLEPTKNSTKQELFYRTAGGRYFKVFIDRDFGSESKSNKSKYFQKQYSVAVMIAVLSSDLWWWYYTLHFDMYNCKDYMMYGFPFDYDDCKEIPELERLGKKLSADMFENAEKKLQSYATTGERMQLIFRPSLSKPIIESIDKVLAKHYGLTEEELDFIVNYDNKYRLGKELEEDE